MTSRIFEDFKKRALDLSGLALAGSVDGLVELFQSRDIAHLNLSDCLLSSKPASQLLASLNGVTTLELKGNDLRGGSVAVLAQVELSVRSVLFDARISF